jgi:tRNA nucleotidyltransferase (CCA-adding enzyme)
LLQQIGKIAERHQMQAYAVGGCVRDWMLGKTRTLDVDVTVEGDGLKLAARIGQLLRGRCRFHQQFGTATVELAGRWIRRLDLATARQETYAKPAAYPRVTPGILEQDLFRRDFTINAMAVALAPGRFGALVDPFGGRQDLQRRILRILHPRSFLDDPSRILRGVRFAQRFRCRFDAATARHMESAIAAGALGWLNAGRLQKEFDRILEEPDPTACFKELMRWLRH